MRSIVKTMWCCGAKSFQSSDDPELEDVPAEGHLRVCAGKDDGILRKFEVEANYLNHPLFKALLRLSREEFGFSYNGALRIACEVDLFLYLVHLLDTGNPSAHYMELSDLVSKFSRSKTTGGEAQSDSEARSVTTFAQLLAEQ